MEYAGIDLHRNYMVVTVLDKRGRRRAHVRLPNDEETVCAFFRSLPDSCHAALESTANWPWLYDLLEAEGVRVHLAHPLKVSAIAEARLKNDRIDSAILAHLLRTGLLPEAYVPGPELRSLRELLRYRAGLVRVQTRVKNRIRALLAKRNLKVQSASLLTKKARAEIERLPLEGRPAPRWTSSWGSWTTWRPSSRTWTPRSGSGPARTPPPRSS